MYVYWQTDSAVESEVMHGAWRDALWKMGDTQIQIQIQIQIKIQMQEYKDSNQYSVVGEGVGGNACWLPLVLYGKWEMLSKRTKKRWMGQ